MDTDLRAFFVSVWLEALAAPAQLRSLGPLRNPAGPIEPLLPGNAMPLSNDHGGRGASS